MERWQIVVICIVFIVIWMAAKRFMKRGKSGPRPRQVREDYKDVDSWYSDAQEQMALLDESQREERQAKWDALSQDQQLQTSEEFMLKTFGPKEVKTFSTDEKLKLGRAYIMTSV